MSETGLASDFENDIYTTDPKNLNSTAAEVTADGSIGIIINSNDLISSQTSNSFGPLPFILSWSPSQTLEPFTNLSSEITANVELQVPYSEAPGLDDTISSNQIVLYLGIRDTQTGMTFALGETLFDSRGVSSEYFGIDDGTGGTGAVAITTPAGTISPFITDGSGSSAFQGGPWSGMRDFSIGISGTTLEASITTANEYLPSTSAKFSSDLSTYQVTSVSLDAETEYFGQANSFAFSVGDFTVSQGNSSNSSIPESSVQTSPTTDVVNTIANGPLPETITVPAHTDYIAWGGSGPLTIFCGQSASTVFGGTGSLTVDGDTGRPIVFGGQESLLFNAGQSAATVIGGSGHATVVGGSGPSLIFGGGGVNYVSGSGATTLVGGAGTIQATLAAGNDIVYGSQLGADSVLMKSGDSTVVGGGGADTFTAVGTGNDILVAGSGNQVINASESTGSLLIFGGSGSDTISSGWSDNLILAGSGNETLTATGHMTTLAINAVSDTTRVDLLYGFSLDSKILLFGFSSTAESLASAFYTSHSTAEGLAIFLSDGTTLIFATGKET